MDDRFPRTRRIGLSCRFSIGSVLLLTIGTAGLLAVLVRPGPVSAGVACLLWVAAGSLAGALDLRVTRGIGALRGPAFAGVLGGALAGLILSAIGMAAARFGRPQLHWPGPGFLFYAYWWASTGAILGGALGCLVSRRGSGAIAVPTHGFVPMGDAPLPSAPVSTLTSRVTWLARWRAWWGDSPSLFASAHLHVVVWTLLSMRVFGMAGRTEPLAKPVPLEPLLATWSESWVDGSAGEQTTGPAVFPAEPTVPQPKFKNPHRPPADLQKSQAGGSAQNRTSGSLVHVVGLYEGTYPNGVSHRGNFHPQGSADVHVTLTTAPTILVLCSYEPVKWNIRVDPGAVVERVILSGYYRQDVAGLPEGVPVSNATGDGRSSPFYFAYKRDHEHYPVVAQGVRESTGMDIATFQGSYGYSGTPFVVGPESKSWAAEYQRYKTQDARRAQKDEAQRAARQKIGDLSFYGIWKSTRNDREKQAWGVLTLDGPVEGKLQPISGFRAVALDPQGPTYYAIRNHSVVKLNGQLKEVTELVLPASLPELSWPCGLTFDTKRGRLILASLGGTGYLYALDRSGKWSLLADLKQVDFGAIAYSEEADALYAIDNGPGGEATIHTLRKYSPQGKLLSTVKINEPIPLDTYRASPQLFAVGPHLVILGPPVPNLDARHEPVTHPMAVVDPASGQVLWSRSIPDNQVMETLEDDE